MVAIATWNVLADLHALPSRYLGVPAELLEPRRRRASVTGIVTELAGAADVVALQEVDEQLAEALQQPGLNVHLLARPHVAEGVALVSRHHLAELAGGTSLDDRRVWLATRIAGVVVVSVHLDWTDPAKASTRTSRQAHELVSWLAERFADAPTVVGGDLNAAWEGDAGSVLAEHGFVPLTQGFATAAIDGVARELDTVAVRGCTGRATRWAELPPVGAAAWLPSLHLPSDHVPLLATVDTAAT